MKTRKQVMIDYTFFNRDYIMDILGLNKNEVRKEKIIKIYGK